MHMNVPQQINIEILKFLRYSDSKLSPMDSWSCLPCATCKALKVGLRIIEQAQICLSSGIPSPSCKRLQSGYVQSNWTTEKEQPIFSRSFVNPQNGSTCTIWTYHLLKSAGPEWGPLATLVHGLFGIGMQMGWTLGSRVELWTRIQIQIWYGTHV